MLMKINLGADLQLNSPVLKIDFYKSMAAYLKPTEHENECFNCCMIMDLNEENKFKLVMEVLSITQGMINSLLNHKPQPPLDEFGEMELSVDKVA